MVSRLEQATQIGGGGVWAGRGAAGGPPAREGRAPRSGERGVSPHLSLSVPRLPPPPPPPARAAAALQLGAGRRLAGAPLDTPVRDQVERRHPFSNARRRVVAGGHQHDAVTEPDLRGALAGSGQEYLGRRGVAVLLQEVMLDLP